VIIAFMIVEAWIKIEDVSVEPWGMSVVYQEAEATLLPEAQARQASQLAERGTNGFEKYTWTYVPLVGTKQYVVRGEAKPEQRIKK
jgi:hypothetical protein